MAKNTFGYHTDKVAERGGGKTAPAGKAGYLKDARGPTDFEGPGSDAYKGDFAGPGTGKDFGGDKG